MMRDVNKGMSCATGCWAMAAGIGFLAFVLLLVSGNTWPGSIFLSVVATGALGFIFSYLFCRELPGPVRPGSAGVSASSAPASTPKTASATAAAPGASVSDAKPEVSSAPASGDAEAGAAVKPSKALAGEEELKSRKGEWRYEGGQDIPEVGESKPETLAAPRDGGADDLKKIKGIGPKLEELCNSMGFYHFDQIAAWTPAEVAWVDQNLEGFKGRVSRDEWVAQAKSLAAGDETEFSQRVDKGDVY